MFLNPSLKNITPSFQNLRWLATTCLVEPTCWSGTKISTTQHSLTFPSELPIFLVKCLRFWSLQSFPLYVGRRHCSLSFEYIEKQRPKATLMASQAYVIEIRWLTRPPSCEWSIKRHGNDPYCKHVPALTHMILPATPCDRSQFPRFTDEVEINILILLQKS